MKCPNCGLDFEEIGEFVLAMLPTVPPRDVVIMSSDGDKARMREILECIELGLTEGTVQ